METATQNAAGQASVAQDSATGSSGLGNELKQDAQHLGAAAQERLSSEAEAHKGQIASQARSVSSALENAAGQLRGEDTPDWLRSAFQQGAEAIQRLADTVERKNPGEMLDDMKVLGREHPGAFLGACAIAGFAAARVFKAGSSRAGTSQASSYGGTESQWSGAGQQPSFSSGSPGLGYGQTTSPGSTSQSDFGTSSAQPSTPAYSGGAV